MQGREFSPFLVREIGFDLLGVRKEVIIAIGPASVVTVARLVFFAYCRPDFVDRAAVVRPKIFATCLKLNVPIAVFYKNRNVLMHEIPPNIVEIASGGRLFQRNRQIPAASRRTMFAQY